MNTSANKLAFKKGRLSISLIILEQIRESKSLESRIFRACSIILNLFRKRFIDI